MLFKPHDTVGWLKSINIIYVVITKSETDNGIDTMYTITPNKNFQLPNGVINCSVGKFDIKVWLFSILIV